MNPQNRFFFGVIVGTLVVGCSAKDGSDKARFGLEGKGQLLAESDADADFNKANEKVTADTRYAAGQLAESRGASGVAIQQYQRALSIDSKHAPSLYRIATILTHQRQLDEAADAWEKYIAAVSAPASGYCNLAFVHILAEKPTEAENAFKKGIEVDGKNKSCRLNYGLMLARAGRMEEASNQWTMIMKPSELHFRLGGVLEQRGDRAAAVKEYQAALEIDPTLKDAQLRIAALN